MTQPDQDPARWDAHVAAYERTFEPLTDAFNRRALDLLAPLDGISLLDVAAGTGGAARVSAQMAEAAALPFPDSTFGAALSSFGVVLLPDPARGVAEMRRVLRPGGRIAVVTWTEPHRYEVAARLRDAVIAVRGAPLEGELPAQLRFTDLDRLRALLMDAGFASVRVEKVEAALHAASAAALAGSLGFAPGMAAMLDALGPDRAAVLRSFTARLVGDQGAGAVVLGAVSHIAVAERP